MKSERILVYIKMDYLFYMIYFLKDKIVRSKNSPYSPRVMDRRPKQIIPYVLNHEPLTTILVLEGRHHPQLIGMWGFFCLKHHFVGVYRHDTWSTQIFSWSGFPHLLELNEILVYIGRDHSSYVRYFLKDKTARSKNNSYNFHTISCRSKRIISHISSHKSLTATGIDRKNNETREKNERRIKIHNIYMIRSINLYL